MARMHTRTRLLTGALLGVVVATSMTLMGATPANAAPLAPTGLQASSDPIPVLSWDPVDTATSYKLQFSDNAGYNAGTFTKTITTTNTRYVPTLVPKEGAFYWRVQAVDGTGTSPHGEPATPTTIGTHLAPSGVTIAPANPTAAIIPPVEPPVITWNGVPGAVTYDVEMDAEGDGVGGTIKTGIKTTSYVWPDPQGVGESGGEEDFFVRVRAKFDNGLQTDWSDADSSDSFVGTRYVVGQLPAATYKGACPAATLCAPDPNVGIRDSVDVEDVAFDWDPVRGAKQYEIWVSQDQNFSSTPVERKLVSGTRYSPVTTYDNANFYWKVRPINAAGQGAPWPLEGSPFRRRWLSAPSQAYPPDSNSSPIAGDLYFQWTPVQHATRYSLEVGTDPNFTPGSYSICQTAQTTFTVGYRSDACSGVVSPLRLNMGLVYYWRVRAIDAPKGINSIYSPISAVVYDPTPPIQVSPENGATVTVPTLKWSNAGPSATHKDATSYLVTLQDKNGDQVDSEITFAQSWTTLQKLDPSLSPYTWTVRGRGTHGHGTVLHWEGWFNYAEPETGVNPLAALPTEYGDSQARFPSLSWQPLATADRYRLTVYNSAGTSLASSTTDVLNAALHNSAVTDWKEYFLTHPGTYTFDVTAYDASNVVLGSTAFADRGTFTIGTLAPVTGQRLALDGAAVDAGQTCDLVYDAGAAAATTCGPVPATPVFDWNPVAGAGGYMVYIFNESDLTTPIYDPQVTSTENTRWTPDKSVKELLAENTAGGAYYWFIRPCVTIRPSFYGCGPDPASLIDSATGAFRKQSPPVQLLSPAASGATAADEITFSWEDYRTTNATFSSYPAGGVKPNQSAMTYRIQVAQSATVTDANAIDDKTVDQTTYTASASLYPEGDLYWRVQAIDAAGNRLAFSATRKVTKATPAANLDPTTNAANERPYVDTTDPQQCRDDRVALGLDTVACNTFPSWQAQVDTGELAFRWPAEPFDSTFALEVYKNNDTTGSTGNRVVFLTGLKQAAAIGSLALAPSSTFADSGAYRWRIRRTDAYANPGAWSDYGKFWVKPAAVSLTSPTTGAPQPPNGPLLTWEPYGATGSQAHHYRVDITNVATSAPVGSVTATSATAFAPTVSYPTGTYRWVVTAYDASDNILGTSPTGASAWTFTVDTSIALLTPTEIQAPDGAQVGKTLTSTAPTWGQPAVTNNYQWQRNGANISGATGPTYAIVVADIGKAISLKVTGKKPGFTDKVSTSDALTASPSDAVIPTTLPSISGVAAARETLTADPGEWPGAGTKKYAYQWFVNGQAVAKATGKTFVVRTRDAGLPVSVRVTMSVTGSQPSVATSAALVVAKLSSTTTASLAKKKITQRERGVLTVEVDLIDLGVTLGQVQVKDGSKVIAIAGLQTGKNGTLTIRLKKLKVGKHKLTVTYLGSVSTLGSKAKTVKLKVIKYKKK